MTEEELWQVEQFVNGRIRERIPLEEQREIPMQQAIDQGAIALFGEKYGNNVRTIRFGKSIELCGGTHVQNTAEIWHFKIVSEGAIAAGIRRIEAITSDAVQAHYAKTEKTLDKLKGLLKSNADPVAAVGSLQEENADLKKELELMVREKSRFIMQDLKGQIEQLTKQNEVFQKKIVSKSTDQSSLFNLFNQTPI